MALSAAVLFTATGQLGRLVGSLGGALGGVVDQITRTPVPSSTAIAVPDAPILTAPGESYTNQPTVDLTGAVPLAAIGGNGYSIRIYQAVADQPASQIADIPVGATPGFTAPGVKLAKGRNDFTATLVSPGGESDRSPVVTYILDTDKPPITISKPAQNAIVNTATVAIAGQTQARSQLVARDEANGASVTGTADGSGAFSLVVGITAGTNGITITATDPAGNASSMVLTVQRGSGALTAKLTASSYQFQTTQLPADLTLTVVVTDPNGAGLDNATVTFTLTIPGIAPVTNSVTTDGTGTATWKTSIPAGATANRGVVAALVETTDYGTTSAQTVITIR